MGRLLMNDITHDKRARISRMHKNECLIIIAPVGQDAAAMATLLDSQGFETQICNGSAEYSRQMMDSAGALLLTEEALESAQGSLLLDLLKAQPPWSELPLIILTSGGESRRAGLLDLAAAAAGSVTLLERPVSTLTLMRSVEVALRSRRRQYQVRDLVSQLANLTKRSNIGSPSALPKQSNKQRNSAFSRPNCRLQRKRSVGA
jgi:FixJ family two-component response regulator